MSRKKAGGRQPSLPFNALSRCTLIFSDTEPSLLELIQNFGGPLPEGSMGAAGMSEALRLSVLGPGITVTSGFFLEVQMRESMHGGESLPVFSLPVPIENCTWNISLVWKKTDYCRRSFRSFLDHTVSFYRTRSDQSILQSVVYKETAEQLQSP